MTSDQFIFWAISGVVAVLLSACWWLIRDRIARAKEDRQFLSTRLGAGSEKMQAIESQISSKVDVIVCAAHREKHEGQHRELMRDISGIREAQIQTQAAVMSLGERVDGSTRTITGLLSKVVTLGERED